MVSKLKKPPDHILEPPLNLSKPDFEFIILWILNINSMCTGTEFLEIQNSESKGVFPKSTLYHYLKNLREKGYVRKSDFNEYQITPSGKDRFFELSQNKYTKRKLNYPPKTIMERRNYEHWILWMVFNNNCCKWSDFLENPLSINQSSLSKNMKLLTEEEFVKKDEESKEYKITPLGKAEYSRMLSFYDLDKQSILEEESKRIKEITKKTIKFFKKYEIKDMDIKFRYLSNVLKLPYENLKIKYTLDEEEDFHGAKILSLSISWRNEAV